MAHFAKIDSNTHRVLRVNAVDNFNIVDGNGQESEDIGIAYLKKLYGNSNDYYWKQTSYNGNMRFRFAGIDYTYSSEHDVFLTPKPYDSWTLNTETMDWEPPVNLPEDASTKDSPDGIIYQWNEDLQNWTKIRKHEGDMTYNWNEETQTWVTPA